MKKERKWNFNPLRKALKSVYKNETVFFFAGLGSLFEAWHGYHTVISMSKFAGFEAVIQAWVFALFVGGGLMIFIVRTNKVKNSKNIKEIERYNKGISFFIGLSIWINEYYWITSVVIEPIWNTVDKENFNWWLDIKWYKLLIAIPLGIYVPKIIEQYAGEITPEDEDEIYKGVI